MIFSETAVKRYREIIAWRVRRIAGASHPDFEDICQEVYVVLHQQLVKLESELDFDRAQAFVSHGAKFATTNFLRSPRNTVRLYSQTGRTVAVRDPLFLQDEDGDWEINPHYLSACTPDFAPALIERLYQESIKDRLLSWATEGESNFLLAYLHTGKFSEAARLFGITEQSMERYVKRTIDRFREEVFHLDRIYIKPKEEKKLVNDLLLLDKEFEYLREKYIWKISINNKVYCYCREISTEKVYLLNMISRELFGNIPNSHHIYLINDDPYDFKSENIIHKAPKQNPSERHNNWKRIYMRDYRKRRSPEDMDRIRARDRASYKRRKELKNAG